MSSSSRKDKDNLLQKPAFETFLLSDKEHWLRFREELGTVLRALNCGKRIKINRAFTSEEYRLLCRRLGKTVHSDSDSDVSRSSRVRVVVPFL